MTPPPGHPSNGNGTRVPVRDGADAPMDDVAFDCLVVDDEPRLRQVLVNLMRHDGYRCLEAGNGAEALDGLEQHRVTLVMSDMRMPRVDGIELLKQVRLRGPDVAVVMITAVSEVETAVS